MHTGSFLVLIATLIAAAPDSVAPELRREYESRVIRVGSDAEAQVRLALWCETNGLEAERKLHLEQALKADQNSLVARGLLGLVEVGGSLASPDQYSRRVVSDPRLSSLLDEYESRRAKSENTVYSQLNLAKWCESVGLKPESVAHYTAVTQLDPNHVQAWTKLGYQQFGDRWLTPAQIAQESAERTARQNVTAYWLPKLAAWKRQLKDDDRKRDAAQNLSKIRDPRAIPAIVQTFADGPTWDQSLAVRMLAAIDSPESAKALVGLAISGRSARVRSEATQSLLRHDPSDFVDDLLQWFRDPIKYTYSDVSGPEKPGVLTVDRPEVVERRIYNPPKPIVSTAPNATANGRPRPNAPPVSVVGADQSSIAAAEKQLKSDVAKVAERNHLIQARNGEVAQVLATISGRDFGPDRVAWTSWWVDQKGESFQPTSNFSTSPKPVVNNIVAINYVPPLIVLPLTTQNLNVPTALQTSSRHSCFAAGTPVLTLRGLRAIEKIQVGDLVLSQDVSSGEISYEPVLASLKNPPASTLLLKFERGEAINSTGIHRFWVPGRGWTMARELKVGDRVRTLIGPTTVTGIEPQSIRPVFNLMVAKTSSFFVGRQSVLVHDHSVTRPVAHPFDAERN